MSRVLGSMLAALLLGGAGSAWAVDLIIAEGEQLSRMGDQTYDQVTIAGTLNVTPHDGVHQESGWLRLGADRIEITENGLIEATGRGYPSSPEDGGTGYESGAGQTPPNTLLPAPGGGGAHYGPGGTGATPNPDCLAFDTAPGGSAYDTEPDPLGLSGSADNRLGGMGSAGGTGRALQSGIIGAGGRGGGMVILVAAQVVIDGSIWANGALPVLAADGAGTNGVPAGGGAGGSIIIISDDFHMGDAARCEARGGSGAVNDIDFPEMLAVGGSGGGGRISLLVGATHQAAHISKLDVAGGIVPAISGCSVAPSGGPGLAEIIDAPACADADGDGFGAAPCGLDCDDTDGSINPDANESCDGVDENCNGEIDEQLWTDLDAGVPDGGVPQTFPAVCAEGFGHQCVNGQCQPFVTGDETPTGKLRLGGGLCSARPGALASGGAAGLLLGLLLALGLRRRRGPESPEQRLR